MRYCIHCGEQIPDDSQFCIHCGKPQFAVQQIGHPSAWEDLKRVVRAFAALISICAFVLAAACTAVLYLGIPDIMSVWNSSVSVYIIFNGVQVLFRADAMLFFYLFFIAALVISLALLIKNSKALKQEICMEPVKEHSQLYTVVTLMMALMFLSTFVQIIIPIILGTKSETINISGLPWEYILFSAAQSPVYEEIVSRILLIGVPLLIVDFILRAVKGAEMKQLRRYILGGGFEFGSKELIFIVVSAILFGYAHLDSWDAFKIIPSTCMGIAAGYLFLKYGVYASISLHAINNLMGFSSELIPGSILAVNILALAMIVFSLPYFISYAAKAIRWVAGKYGRNHDV